MIATPTVIDVPLRTDESGVIRVGQTRVTLMTIIARYHAGDSPEAIHEGFPTVSLGNVYTVIAYYLAHRADVDAYIQQELTAHEQLRRDWESTHPSTLTRAVLLARLAARRDQGNDV